MPKSLRTVLDDPVRRTAVVGVVLAMEYLAIRASWHTEGEIFEGILLLVVMPICAACAAITVWRPRKGAAVLILALGASFAIPSSRYAILGHLHIVQLYNGRPLGPMEFRVRTARGLLSTRPGVTASPPAHIDELAEVMADSRRWNLARPLVHIVDREADSVGHFRKWQAAGHQFLGQRRS